MLRIIEGESWSAAGRFCYDIDAKMREFYGLPGAGWRVVEIMPGAWWVLHAQISGFSYGGKFILSSVSERSARYYTMHAGQILIDCDANTCELIPSPSQFAATSIIKASVRALITAPISADEAHPINIGTTAPPRRLMFEPTTLYPVGPADAEISKIRLGELAALQRIARNSVVVSLIAPQEPRHDITLFAADFPASPPLICSMSFLYSVAHRIPPGGQLAMQTLRPTVVDWFTEYAKGREDEPIPAADEDAENLCALCDELGIIL